MKVEGSLAGYKAVAKLYNALMTGLVLTLVTRESEEAARDFVFAHFRRQHLEKFKDGLAKLGLDKLPDAVACAQYHYFSNALGGVRTEYMAESDRKAWVRYPPPRWIWQGAAICAVPRSVNEAMLHGWHGHNGVTLGNPRLGFVCTGETVNGDPGLEGYYYEYDREIAPEERVRFAFDERPPRFDPAKAPKLDSANWPEERLKKVERSYAMEYVRSLIPALESVMGSAGFAHLARAARLIGLQTYVDIADLFAMKDDSAETFAHLLASLAAAQGETVTHDGTAIHQSGFRLLNGVPIENDHAAFAAWNELWQAMLAVHNRDLTLITERSDAGIVWRVEANA
jgi:hypothetical protein